MHFQRFFLVFLNLQLMFISLFILYEIIRIILIEADVEFLTFDDAVDSSLEEIYDDGSEEVIREE